MVSARRAEPGALQPGAAAAIATHFDGDAALHAAFANDCRQQFAIDADVGQRACEAGDLRALRRLAHDLESVLLVLGHAELSQLAGRVEQCAAADDLAAACMHWRAVRSSLLLLRLP